MKILPISQTNNRYKNNQSFCAKVPTERLRNVYSSDYFSKTEAPNLSEISTKPVSEQIRNLCTLNQSEVYPVFNISPSEVEQYAQTPTDKSPWFAYMYELQLPDGSNILNYHRNNPNMIRSLSKGTSFLQIGAMSLEENKKGEAAIDTTNFESKLLLFKTLKDWEQKNYINQKDKDGSLRLFRGCDLSKNADECLEFISGVLSSKAEDNTKVQLLLNLADDKKFASKANLCQAPFIVESAYKFATDSKIDRDKSLELLSAYYPYTDNNGEYPTQRQKYAMAIAYLNAGDIILEN